MAISDLARGLEIDVEIGCRNWLKKKRQGFHVTTSYFGIFLHVPTQLMVKTSDLRNLIWINRHRNAYTNHANLNEFRIIETHGAIDLKKCLNCKLSAR